MSSLPCLPHTPKGFVHCTVLFLLKNPAHERDKWFKNNPHKEINRGGGVGQRRKWEASWVLATCILSFRHASEGWQRGSGSSPGWPSTSARHLESGSGLVTERVLLHMQ